MYAYIKGIVQDHDGDSVVLEAGGIGYRIIATGRAVASARQGEMMQLFTYFCVRDDAMLLYGFLTREEKRMFEKLISVTGVGPKMAVSILSALSAQELAMVLVTGDCTALVRVPGVGKKTAQRLILELKEKVDNQEYTAAVQAAGLEGQDATSDAVAALMALGYDHMQAVKAVRQVSGHADKIEEMVFLALKYLDAGKV